MTVYLVEHINKLWPKLLIIGCIFSIDVFAADASKGIVKGSVIFLPTVTAAQRYDDNIFSSAQREQDSFVTVLNPAIATLIESDASEYLLSYDIESAWYWDSSDDDYLDHFLAASGKFFFSRDTLLNLKLNYDITHEDRGTGLSQGFDPLLSPVLSEPDEYDVLELAADYRYGRRDSLGQLIVEIIRQDKKYNNHRDRTRVFDREGTRVAGTVYYRVTPNTRLLFETSIKAIDYPNERQNEPSLDSTSFNYLLGATWDITGVTTGRLKVGYLDKDFDSSQRSDFSGISWQVEVRWSPRDYSHFDLRADRYDEETNNINGDFIDTTEFSGEWTHEWSDRFETLLGLHYKDEEYENTDRDEQLFEVDARLFYHMRHWLTWGLGVKGSDQDSNRDELQFDRSIYSLEVIVTI